MKRIMVIAVVAACLAAPLFASGFRGWFEDGLGHFEAQRYDDAIKSFSRAIEINPNLAIAYNNRGLSWRLKNEIKLAIADYSQAIKIDPEFADAYNNRATAWFYQCRWSDALADCAKVLEIDPDRPWASNQMAWILATCPDEKYRDGEKAVKMAKHALKYNNKSVFRDTLAAAYAETGQFEQAVVVMKKIVSELKQKGGSGLDHARQVADFQVRLGFYKAGRPWRSLAKSLEPQPEKHDFSIQAGAFLSKENATNHAASLRSKGYPARVLELFSSSGKVWHLVLVGYYPTHEQAKQAAADLTARENVATAVHAAHAP